MSDTDTKVFPPVHEFVAEPDGLTQWRAEFDGITVQRVGNDIRVLVFRGNHRIEHLLTGDQARHLGRLIMEAAE